MLRSHVCLLVPVGHHRVEEHPDRRPHHFRQCFSNEGAQAISLSLPGVLVKNAKCWDLESAFSVSLPD